MPKLTPILGAAALCGSLAAPLAAQDADTVVATVGDTEITLGEMIILRAGLPQQYAQFPDEVLFEGILDQLVQQQILADSLDDVPQRVELALANERRSLLAGEVVNEVVSGAITDEAIQAAYDEQVAGSEQGTEWNASHLLVETEEEALAAKDRVEGGEDFAEVAMDVSTGPSGPSGGELGWFGTGMMVGPFEEAVSGMEAGDLSDPVQTQFGWHIIKLNETRQASAPSLDQVREEIVARLQEQAIDARIEELKSQVTVDTEAAAGIDPALLSDLSLLEPGTE